MTDLIFQNPAEAAAWDRYLAAMMGASRADMGYQAPRDALAHNADAMLLERRKRMAPEKAEREWIAHKPGDPMPCDGDDYVMVMFRNHAIPPARMQAIAYSWEETGGAHTITAWRPA